MNTKITNILLIGILAILVIGLFASFGKNKLLTNLGGDLDLTRREKGVYTAKINVSTTTIAASTNLVLSTNATSTVRRIEHVSGAGATCQLNSSTSTLQWGVGIIIDSTHSYQRDFGYFGVINCISTSSTSTISVTEY